MVGWWEVSRVSGIQFMSPFAMCDRPDSENEEDDVIWGNGDWGRARYPSTIDLCNWVTGSQLLEGLVEGGNARMNFRIDRRGRYIKTHQA